MTKERFTLYFPLRHQSYARVILYGNVDKHKNLQKDQRSHIFDAMAEQNYSKGDVIIKQGDPGNYFYVIGKLLFPVTTHLMLDSR